MVVYCDDEEGEKGAQHRKCVQAEVHSLSRHCAVVLERPGIQGGRAFFSGSKPLKFKVDRHLAQLAQLVHLAKPTQ